MNRRTEEGEYLSVFVASSLISSAHDFNPGHQVETNGTNRFYVLKPKFRHVLTF